MSSSDDQPTTDQEVTAAEVEATDEAAEAEGHAESTAAGESVQAVADQGGDAAQAPAGAASESTDLGEAASADAEANHDDLRKGLVETLTQELGDGLIDSHIIDGDDLWVRVSVDSWVSAAEVAKNKLGCVAFCFLSAIDWLPSPWGRYEDTPFDDTTGPESAADDVTEFETGYAGGDTRFQVFMRLTNPSKGFGVTIKADVVDPDVGVATIISVFPGANWHEREAHEMYGINFIGHPHLVKLYLPGDFEGHPLRKDFPLLARQVKPWPGVVDIEPMPEPPEDEAPPLDPNAPGDAAQALPEKRAEGASKGAGGVGGRGAATETTDLGEAASAEAEANVAEAS